MRNISITEKKRETFKARLGISLKGAASRFRKRRNVLKTVWFYMILRE